MLKWRSGNRNHVRTYDRQRRTDGLEPYDPEHYLRHKTKILEGHKADPEKYKARSIINNAIAAGKITRQPCEVCGDPNTEAHHDDYSKPFDVRHLCTRHHGELQYVYGP
jgi:hypothetical protein